MEKPEVKVTTLHDGSVEGFYNSIDPMELLILHSITTVWKTGSFTVYIDLACDADKILDSELIRGLGLEQTSSRSYIIRLGHGTTGVPDYINKAVRCFYERHGLPAAPTP